MRRALQIIICLSAIFAAFAGRVPLRALSPGFDGSGEAISQQIPDEGSLNMEEYLFGHISDAYEWHIATWKGEEIVIPLPCIVFDGGLKVFSSKQLEHGATFDGLRIAAKGEPHEGKIVRASDGSRPFDISITKNVLGLIVDAIILIVLILLCSRWYRRHMCLKRRRRALRDCWNR